MAAGNMLNLVMDGLQEQKSEAAVDMGSPNQVEDWKNALSDESGFLLGQTDGRVRICFQQYKSIDLASLVSVVQATSGGVMVWENVFLVPLSNMTES